MLSELSVDHQVPYVFGNFVPLRDRDVLAQESRDAEETPIVFFDALPCQLDGRPHEFESRGPRRENRPDPISDTRNFNLSKLQPHTSTIPGSFTCGNTYPLLIISVPFRRQQENQNGKYDLGRCTFWNSLKGGVCRKNEWFCRVVSYLLLWIC